LSGFVCAISRADHGDKIRSVRLVGADGSELWTPSGVALDDPAEAPAEAARWVGERLSSRGVKSLRAICIDSDGAVCGWTRPLTPDARAIEAEVRRSGGEVVLSGTQSGYSDARGGMGELEPGGGDTLTLDISSPGAGDVETLRPVTGHTAGTGPSPERAALLIARDAAVQVFMGWLEREGIHTDRVLSDWHLLAEAWSSAGPTGQADVVAEMPTVTAAVMIEPRGRLVWSWFDASGLITGGRLALFATDRGPWCSPRDVGRLVADWLGWAAQLGLGPTRVVLITPSSMNEPGEGRDGTRADDDHLTTASLGELLASRWPGATVDAASFEDPLAESLVRQLARDDARDAAPTRVTEAPSPDADRVRSTRRSMVLAAALVLVGAAGTGLWLIQGAVESSRIEQREFGILAGGLLLGGALVSGWLGVRWLGQTRAGPGLDPSMDPRRSLVGLSARPTRTTRAAYRWGAASLALAGLVSGAFGWRAQRQGQQAASVAAQFQSKANRLYMEQGLEPASGGAAVLNMEAFVSQERQRVLAPSDLPPPRPMLPALDSIMLVLGNNQPEVVELDRIFMTENLVQVYATVPTLDMFVDLRESLRAVDSALTNWSAEQTRLSRRRGGELDDRFRTTFSAAWKEIP